MIDVVFDASIAEVLDDYMADQRLKDALFGQGIIGAWAARRTRAPLDQAHALPGRPRGRRPVWGYVRGGMGIISFAIAEAAEEAGAMLASGVPVAEILPGEGVGSRTARHPRVDGRLQRRSEGRAARCSATTRPPAPATASRPGSSAARSSSSTPRSTGCRPGPPPPARTSPPAARSTSPPASTPPSARSSAAPTARPPSASARSTSRPSTTRRPAPRRQAPAERVRPVRALRVRLGQPRASEVARQFIDLIAAFAPDFEDCLEHYEVLGPPDIEAADRPHRRQHLPGRDDARPDVGAPARRRAPPSPASTSAAPRPTRRAS